MATNPFDFTDLSDLPDDLAKKLHTDTNDHAKEYAGVVLKGAEAGLTELDINQITAAALRMGMEVPTQQTVRGYLNKAVELGLISKPSRQTYGPPMQPETSPKSKGRTKADETGLEDAVTTAEPETTAPADDDPLAGL